MKTVRTVNLSAAVMFIFPIIALSLAAQQSSTLIIAGHPGSAEVIQRDGINFVEVEGLARLTNGSIRFHENQIVLTLPGATPASVASVPPPTGFSKGFVTAGIEVMSQIREWRAALTNTVEHNYPIGEGWLGAPRAQTQQALRLASVAVSTASDRSAFPFLTSEFNNMSTLTDNYLRLSASNTYIEPSSLVNNPLNQKILACAQSLASMATANQFVDDGSCD